ncbi:M16 family metallopeptidase [Paenimyroides aestuarii]|uniref:Insulinase family protein n=1 Tax=Paenimyroides aestuarii TaxID=2968490 RepID=A0ABY5NSP6_9FLAO|nr:pitrilysin family protein [Paenimyroides aestuarii]UUV21594.1 insulinase family protein [Paenimyroides aestuarii]
MKKILVFASALLLTISAEAQIKRPQPKPGPMPTVNVQKPQEFTMKNGLKVMVVEDHKLPRVSYMLTIDTPPYVEGEKAGVSSLTSAVVGNGTTKTSKEKFNDEIDFLGANVNFWNTGASASGLSKYSSRLLELMAEGSLNPLFDQEEFDKAKQQAIEGLKTDEKSVPSVARRVTNALLFGTNHPTGEFITEETLNNVTLADVKQNYASYFVPENAYLVVVGDVKFKDVKKQVEKLFKNWKKASAPVAKYPEPNDVVKTQIDFVDMPNAVQSEIALVNTVNLKLTDKDYFAALIANQILGGGGEGRLFLNLREAHGWTYGAYSSLGSGKYTSKFTSSASVRNVVTDSAVVEFVNELQKIRTQPVTQAELDLAKAKYIGNFVMETQKPGTIASFALRTKTQSLPADFYENYIKNIQAVTVADVQRVANKYFKKDNQRIVIVGKGADVAGTLDRLGYPVNYYDKYANPVEKPVFKKAAPAGVTSKTVIENHIKAIGGEAKLQEAKSVAMVAKGTMQGMEITLTQKQTAKGQKMVSLNGMGMELMKQVITPTMGYMSGQGQKQELKGDDLKDAQASAKMFDELEDLKNAASFELAGIETFNGEEVYVLKKDKQTTFYSVASGLKVGSSETMEAQGQTVEMTTAYSDYKAVKGIKFPHSFTVPMLGNAEFKVSDIKVNEGVTDADFK